MTTSCPADPATRCGVTAFRAALPADEEPLLHPPCGYIVAFTSAAEPTAEQVDFNDDFGKTPGGAPPSAT